MVTVFDGDFLLVRRMLTGAMGNLLPPSLNAMSGLAVPTKVLWVQRGRSTAVQYGNSYGKNKDVCSQTAKRHGFVCLTVPWLDPGGNLDEIG